MDGARTSCKIVNVGAAFTALARVLAKKEAVSLAEAGTVSSNFALVEKRAVRGAGKRRDSFSVFFKRSGLLPTARRRESRHEESVNALTAVLPFVKDCGIPFSTETCTEFLDDDLDVVREGARAFAWSNPSRTNTKQIDGLIGQEISRRVCAAMSVRTRVHTDDADHTGYTGEESRGSRRAESHSQCH